MPNSRSRTFSGCRTRRTAAISPGVESSGKALEDRVKKQARDIREKYVEPPHTTDFALLYLPVESLYGEVLRRPGLADTLQREYQVTLAGPTTLAAILNSLQMGFRTLAIEQRSSEVRKLLGAVKTDFGKFGDLLSKTKKQLDTVSNTLGDAEVRTRAIERKLRGVEALPAAEADRLLTDEDGVLYEADADGSMPMRCCLRRPTATDDRRCADRLASTHVRSHPQMAAATDPASRRDSRRAVARGHADCGRFSRSTTTASSSGCARRSCSSCTRRRSSARAATR